MKNHSTVTCKIFANWLNIQLSSMTLFQPKKNNLKLNRRGLAQNSQIFEFFFLVK